MSTSEFPRNKPQHCVPNRRAHVHPDGGCFVAGRGWVRCRVRARPSGRRLVLLGTCSRAVARCGLCVLSGFVPPGGRHSLAPVRVPWLWPRRTSLACLVAPRGAPRLVRAGRSRCCGRLSRRHDAFRHPWGFRPRIYWAAARCTRRPVENRAHCACCWPLPRQGRWARSASYPFGAPQWGCALRVPLASVLGCVRCSGLRVWTRSLTRPVSRTVRLSTGDSAGASGLFRVDADTFPFWSEDAAPGLCACVLVHALLGRVGRAGLPGTYWCASPFRRPLCPAALLGPLQAGVAPFLSFCLPSFFFPSPGAPAVSSFLWFPAPGFLGLGTPCPHPPPNFFFFSVFFLPVRWVWCLFPFGLLRLVFVSFWSAFPLSPRSSFFLSFFSSFSASPAPLFSLWVSRCSAPRVLVLLVCVCVLLCC